MLAACCTRNVYAGALASIAIREAMALATGVDRTVILMVEDVGLCGGAFQMPPDLADRFGPDGRADFGIGRRRGAVGAALTGLKPIFDIPFSDFAMLAIEQIVNQAAKLRFLLGSRAAVLVVFRLPSGSGTRAAAQHSQSIEVCSGHASGLKVLQPSSPEAAKVMLTAVPADPNPDPAMIFEHKLARNEARRDRRPLRRSRRAAVTTGTGRREIHHAGANRRAALPQHMTVTLSCFRVRRRNRPHCMQEQPCRSGWCRRWRSLPPAA